jgi:hypothetical protein
VTFGSEPDDGPERGDHGLPLVVLPVRPEIPRTLTGGQNATSRVSPALSPGRG